jgi:hypothetical protein
MGLSTDAVAVTKPATLDQAMKWYPACSAAAGQTRRSDSMMPKACLGSVGALALVSGAVGVSSVQTSSECPSPSGHDEHDEQVAGGFAK